MQPKIGEKLRLRRKELGYTLKELAGNRITPAQISAIENGKCNPSEGLLDYLCKKMNVDIEYFTKSNEELYKATFDVIKNKCKSMLEKKEYKAAIHEIDKTDKFLDYLTETHKGDYYFIKGEIFYGIDNFAKAFDYFADSLTHFIKTGDNDRISDTYIKIGNCLYSMEKFNMAVGYYLNASTYIDKNISDDITVKIYYNLAICNVALQRLKLGKEYIDKCRNYIMEHECSKKDIYLPGIDVLEGLVLREFNDHSIGLKNFEEAYEKYKNENNLGGMAVARNNAALCLWDLGRSETAVKYLEESLDLKIKAGDKTPIDTYLNLIEIYMKLGKIDEAFEIAGKAEEKMIESGFDKGLAEIFMAKFELCFEMQNYEKAENFAYIALDIIQKNGYTKMESNIYIKMSEMHKKMGDDEGSLEYILKANALSSEYNYLD